MLDYIQVVCLKQKLKTVIDKKQTKKYYDILEFMKKLTREVIKISSENYE